MTTSPTLTLSVGQPYPGWRPTAEGSHYTYARNGHGLLHVWPRPSRAEQLQVRQGPIRIAVVEHHPVVWLCWKHGPQPWSDSPYSWHLVPESARQLPPEEHAARGHALLRVTLVDGETGIVRGLRAVTLSPVTTGALHGAIRRQAAAPFSHEEYTAAIEAAYARYRTSADLAATAIASEIAGR